MIYDLYRQKNILRGLIYEKKAMESARLFDYLLLLFVDTAF